MRMNIVCMCSSALITIAFQKPEWIEWLRKKNENPLEHAVMLSNTLALATIMYNIMFIVFYFFFFCSLVGWLTWYLFIRVAFDINSKKAFVII